MRQRGHMYANMHNCSGDEYDKGHRHTYSALEARGSRAMHTGTRTHRHRKLQKHNQTTQTRPFTFIRPILSDFQKVYHFFATTYEHARTLTRTHNGTGKFLHARGMCRMPARAFQESHCVMLYTVAPIMDYTDKAIRLHPSDSF